MRKLNKEKFLKTELGASMVECVTAWDEYLEKQGRYLFGTADNKKYRKACEQCQVQWEIYKMAIRQFYGIEYYFSRNGEHFGICSGDGSDWLFKVNRTQDAVG